ncbi:MAG: protein O-mannosyl-transferase family [Hyphomicrobiales bacterium]
MGNFNFKKINNIIGWVLFFIATIVYTLTIEPTQSWWDPGEFIATSYKLQVGHPPGAPTFALLGRLFSLFAFGDGANVAFAINMLSAVASAASVMFIYWIIVMLGKKIIRQEGEISTSKQIAVLGSGIIGALALTFSDSFWFSAVEAEVYALSCFFTAITFWVALKWENEVDKGEGAGLRYLIFLFFLIGLAVGVHMLNLLTIPAVFYIVYFKKYKFSNKGFIYTGILSVIFLAIVLFGIIPLVVKFSFLFDYVFVNGFGLPFNTGTIFYFILIVAGLIFGIRYTQKHKKHYLNAALLGLTFLLVGYSTFFTIVIRSNANPPINENSPTDAVSLLSYLNREQYGSWPLMKGQYYNAPLVDTEETSNVYAKDEEKGEYKVIDKGFEYIYDDRFVTMFPRMWSNQKPAHVKIYKQYGNIKGKPVEVVDPYTGETKIEMVPTFGENLRFFFTYQLGHMYFRYFLWNFVGRQNDIESQGEILNGNWKSGIDFIDSALIGPQDNLPKSMENPGSTAFYFLPLLLGLIGLFYHIGKSGKDAWIVFILFFLTGIAIVFYLNQYPYQPRERDYAYAGSFMAFCIWIGLGVLALYDFVSVTLSQKMRKVAAVGVTVAALLLVPTIMANSGWDLHNRQGKTSALDWAKNYLNSCEENAIIFTNGDNDTFPLWYAQEVEGYRTDVRVVNHMLAGGAWYCHQMGRKVYDSDRIPLTLDPSDYDRGNNDQVFVDTRNNKRVELIQIIKWIKSKNKATYRQLTSNKSIKFLPTNKLKLSIDKEAALRSGTVPTDKADQIVDEFSWNIKSGSIMKNDVLLLDLIASNNWQRPVYFVNPSAVSKTLGISKYMHREGLAFRLRPYPAEDYVEGTGGIDIDRTYKVLIEDAKWGNLNKDNVTVDRESVRNTYFAKDAYRHLANALVLEEDNNKAVEVLDKAIEFFPNNKIAFDYYMLSYAELYYQAGAVDKGNEMVTALSKRYFEEIIYFNKFDDSQYFAVDYNNRLAMDVIRRLAQMAEENKQSDLALSLQNMLIQILNAEYENLKTMPSPEIEENKTDLSVK